MRQHAEALLDYAEEMARREIESIPDGTFSFVDHLDDDGLGGDPVDIHVTMRKSGSDIEVDFTGSSKQAAGALNAVLAQTRSSVYCAVRSVMRSPIPDNEGFYRPIRIVAPEGTVVNPSFPAAVAAKGVTAHRVCDAVLGALAQAAPERVMASDEGGSSNVNIGGLRPDGSRFVLVEFLYGAWGGRPGKDGIDGISNLAANISNNPVEFIEAEFPLRIERYGFASDTGGAGRFRGGLAVRREYRILNPSGAVLSVRSDRRRFPPCGVFGGSDGSPPENILNPGPGEERLPTKFVRELRHGDRFRHTLAGAGGYGDPLERDPDRVLEDCRDQKVGIEQAAALYGVVVDAAGFRVDAPATADLRRRMRAGRPRS